MLAFWANGKHSVKGFHPMENSMLMYIYFETNTTLNLFSFIFLTFFSVEIVFDDDCFLS